MGCYMEGTSFICTLGYFFPIKTVSENIDMINFPEPQIKIDFMSHISTEIKTLYDSGELITLEKYKALVINSYEAKYIEPHLDNEAFLYKLGICFKNTHSLSEYELPITYEGWMGTDGIRQSYKRLLALIYSINIIKEQLDLLKSTHTTNLSPIISMIEQLEWRKLI